MPAVRIRSSTHPTFRVGMQLPAGRHRNYKSALRAEVKLLGTKVTRAGVFAWMTLIAVVISEYEARGSTSTYFLSNHFIFVVILAPFCTFFTALSAYVANDLADVKVDRINAPRRPMVTKIATRNDAIFLIVFLDIAALGLASLLGLLATLIVLAEIAGSVMYSFRPLGLSGSVWKTFSIGIAGAVSSVFGAVVIGQGITSMIAYAAAMSFIYLFATSPLNDLGDREGDKAEGRRTIPIVAGQRNTVKLSIVASVVPFLSCFVLFHGMNTTIVMAAVLGMVSLRSLQLLLPLLRSYNHETIRKNHRKMIPLHFVLQAAILLGAISIPL